MSYVASRVEDGGGGIAALVILFLLSLFGTLVLHLLIWGGLRIFKVQLNTPKGNRAATYMAYAFLAGFCLWCVVTSARLAGLSYELEPGTGASGSYATIKVFHTVNGTKRAGPECDGSDPAVWFADRTGDFKREITCYGDGFEAAVFELVSDPSCSEAAFRLLRGGHRTMYPEGGLFAQYGKSTPTKPAQQCVQRGR